MNPPADEPPAAEVRILLVDDHPPNLLALEAVLADLGQEMVRANSGTQALSLLAVGDFAVVLLDLQMPGLDGFQTARLIRGRERSRHTPIIFLTAHDGDDFPLVQAYELGAVDYLVKPLIPAILRAKVAVFVELAQKAIQLRLQGERLHRAERDRAERAALAQYAVAGALAESANPCVALPAVLRVACETLGWDAGGLWVVNRDAGVLRCTAFWSRPDAAVLDFEADSRRRVFQPGEGLPGRTWAAGETAWIEDVALDDNFPRVRPAVDAGLRGACALPIRLGGEVIGVLEVFALQARPRDEAMLRALTAVGVQVGQSLERRRAEDELRRSEGRFAGFMRHLPGLAWIKDEQGRYVYANDTAEKAFRTPRERLYGRTDEEVFPPETAAQFRENDRLALAGGAVRQLETLEHEDGVHYSLVSKFAIPEQDGGPPLVGGIAIDVTDRLRAEEALREAGRRKDEFLALLGHELRNPLSPIRSAVEILRLAGSGPLAEQARDVIDRQTAQLTRLVDDLLDASRVSHGKITLRRALVELAALVSAAVETCRPLLEAGHHTFAVEVPGDPVWLDADPARLTQVLVNLLSNACKYTPPGGSVHLCAEVSGGGEVVFRVRDSGVGIAPEMLGRVFEMFTQLDRSPARANQWGLGVGLALVKALVELHGGSVAAFSAGQGRGSEFVVRLPGPASEAREQAPAPAVVEVGAVVGRPLRVLVVDDSADGVETLALLLGLAGHRVRAVPDGPSALEAAASFRPEAVLLDVGLPGMDGYEVARRLRRQEGMREALVVALTGYGAEADRRRALEAGCDEHLVKPVEPEVLTRLLGAWAGRAGHAGE